MADPQPIPSFGIDPAQLLLIVVGAHLRAEMADRPLAYRLAESIHQWLRQRRAALNVPLAPLVCSDIWYMNQEVLQARPTISVGGPGVNALSAFFAQKLPQPIIIEKTIVVQLDREFVDLRACVWGTNHQVTVAALDYFTSRYLDTFLRAAVTQVEPQTD